VYISDINFPVSILSYGFVKNKTSSTGVDFYTKKIEKNHIELMVADNIYTLSMKQGNGKEYVIASRYKVQSQEELNFLIFNGRAGAYFK
jgi:spore coat protein U-like protein